MHLHAQICHYHSRFMIYSMIFSSLFFLVEPLSSHHRCPRSGCGENPRSPWRWRLEGLLWRCARRDRGWVCNALWDWIHLPSHDVCISPPSILSSIVIIFLSPHPPILFAIFILMFKYFFYKNFFLNILSFTHSSKPVWLWLLFETLNKSLGNQNLEDLKMY